jgi:GNAT superfamily N-acetyltransferase
MAEGGWSSVRYTAADAGESLELVRRTWGDIDPADPAYHEWQCRRSPGGPAIATLARDEREGRVVGQEVTIPIRATVSGRECTANLSLNSATDPAWRGRGIFGRLLSDACDLSAKEGMAFTYGFPNQWSYPIFLRTGFADIGSVPLLIKPLNPQRLVRKATGNRLLGAAAWPASLIWHQPAAGRREGSGQAEIVRVEKFDDSFTAFWERVKNRFPVMIVRDAAYLNWRFVDIPLRKYVCFAARAEDEVKGFIALRVAPVASFNAGLVVDLLVEEGESGAEAGRALIDEAFRHFREHDLDMLGSLALAHTREFRLLREKGFWVCPKRLLPQPFPIIVRCHEGEGSPSRLAYELVNWFVTMGDYDAV